MQGSKAGDSVVNEVVGDFVERVFTLRYLEEDGAWAKRFKSIKSFVTSEDKSPAPVLYKVIVGTFSTRTHDMIDSKLIADGISEYDVANYLAGCVRRTMDSGLPDSDYFDDSDNDFG